MTALPLEIIILAAGKGTRMLSKLPKVMQTIAGKPLLAHVIDTSNTLSPLQTVVVVGHGKDAITDYFDDPNLKFVEQTEQKGTGHAVVQALPALRNDSVTLILYGDVPLVRAETLNSLVDVAQKGDLALLTMILDDPTGYGRIIRKHDKVTKIVEQKDGSVDELAVKEVNTGIIAVKSQYLADWLPKLQNNNAQGEYYLTDIVALAVEDGVQVSTVNSPTEIEVTGINNRKQQAELERAYQAQLATGFLAQGLCLADPARFDVRGTLAFGMDCQIDVNCVFEGKVTLGDDVVIESNCVIKNANIGSGTRIKANTVIEDSVIEDTCDIGPFARIRPGSHLKTGAKAGNFVETKKAIIGVGSKVNHLSYVGDAEVGDNVNIGAGTITCNYDGANKHLTKIDDGVFIGSNTALVAPVHVGKNATVGAGSIITQDVKEADLAIARSKQKNLSGWQRPTKNK